MDPEEQLTKFGVDPIRYFLLAEGSLHRDGGTLDYCCDAIQNTHPTLLFNPAAMNE